MDWNSINIYEIWNIVSYPFNIIYVLVIIFIIILLILENGSPTKTIAWILIFILLPLVGFILYFFFGRNFRKEKIFSRLGIENYNNINERSTEQLHLFNQEENIMNKQAADKINIINLLLKNANALLSTNNSIDILNNGDETFCALISDIEEAKKHIHLQFYIIENDIIGNKIKKLLIEKARQGVKVRVVYDDVGSWSLPNKYLKELESAGVEVFPFMPVRFSRFADRINYRNHRKIVVIDGSIGYIGGINIADRYINGHKKYGIWRDIHLRIIGDAVHSLQAIFLIDWFFITNKIIEGKDFYKVSKSTGNKLIQIAASGPDSDWPSIMQALFLAISTAKKYVYVSTPYFTPNESILTALKTAALSGVDVRILLPEKSDSHIVFWGSVSYVKELLEADIKVYFYKKGFNHSKLMIVDDSFATVGSANIDIRSFDTNFEVNAFIYDKDTAINLKNDFINDISNSVLISSEYWANRPPVQKLKASIARILSPLF